VGTLRLPPLATDVEHRMNAQPIPCAQIRPDPRSRGYQPPAVEWLADDIREHGVLRPVLVRATEQGYVIVHGERRWRAATMLGLEVIPAYVVQGPADDASAATDPARRQ
jgi:ParB family chromosome partitioning protein